MLPSITCLKGTKFLSVARLGYLRLGSARFVNMTILSEIGDHDRFWTWHLACYAEEAKHVGK
jgi:hypothetical protein